MNEKRGIAYMVVNCEDISQFTYSAPGVWVDIGKGRRTIKWRGKRFNVFAGRVVGFGAA